jgi:hypothetical protein
MATLSNKKVAKSCKEYICNICDYNTSRKSSYEKHLISRKHLRQSQQLTNGNNWQQKVAKVAKDIIYTCEKCNKEYNNRSGLWRHKKQCNDNLLISNIEPKLTTNIFFELLKQNTEFKELIVEQNNYIIEQNKQNHILQNHLVEITKEKNNNVSNIINNTTNNHFNLNVFLNETCKNAMNINEFIDRIQVNISDLEDTARLGYAEGISRIFIRGLKELEINERPIHCSDGKRETIYIKDGDIWEKDDINQTKLTNAIRKIGHKNMRMITEWRKLYPNCNEYDSNKNDLYLKIVSNSMCGGTEEETENNYNKIRKNIIKEVIIIK